MGRGDILDIIASKDNPRIRDCVRLSSQKKARVRAGLFVLEGVKLLEEAVRSGIEIESVYITRDCLDSGKSQLAVLEELSGKTFLVTDAAASRLFQSKTPQGVCAVCRIPEHCPDFDKKGRYLGLWELQDPGNVGTMIRTADALGFDGVILSEGCCDLYNLKTVRAAMGSLFRMPLLVTDMQNFIRQHQKDLTFYASVVDADAPGITGIRFPAGSVMMIGNEGNGLSAEQVALCGNRVTIPMTGRAESFNAAMAATILMWEMSRQP